MTASRYVAFINRKVNLCIQTSLFLRHYKSGCLSMFFKYSLLFKHDLGQNRYCCNHCLIPGFTYSEAGIVNPRHAQFQCYTQFHFDLMPQSCDHFIVSHDFFLLKRKKDNRKEYAVSLPILCSQCDNYRHLPLPGFIFIFGLYCVFTDL